MVSQSINEDGVKAFVRRIFSLYDRKVPVFEVLPFLVAEGLQTNFPDSPTIRNHGDFERWYNGAPILRNTHEVNILRVETRPNGEFGVEMRVDWNADLKTGEAVSMQTTQRWIVVNTDGVGLQIKNHSATKR